MALVDDLATAVPDLEMSRRKALGVMTGAAWAVAGLGTAITTVRYLRPNVLFEPPTRFRVALASELSPGTLVVLPEQRLYVVRSEAGFYALSAVCTHLGCMTRHEPAMGRIFCPCDGSEFDEEGRGTGGPAPAALARVAVEIEDGVLVVDVRKPVAPDFVLAA